MAPSLCIFSSGELLNFRQCFGAEINSRELPQFFGESHDFCRQFSGLSSHLFYLGVITIRDSSFSSPNGCDLVRPISRTSTINDDSGATTLRPTRIRIEAYNPGFKALPHRHLRVLSVEDPSFVSFNFILFLLVL
ncbi:uncharacterized protein LOC126626917 [Malus sylvestris]|uniref:uncharacterized protein LOC126626917 n=1 Tax=Malus sylvestris TaxID=3752 RepID=UPI0021AD318D|nr:uncharacterized protein LOC126626917 [Malus sylvestris]